MAGRMNGIISNVQYEDFRPKSEWKEENAANILHIHLPDFKKEQLRITYVHSTRIIRITGEREIVPTKWARFNQTYAVPQNCEVNNIHAKFADGILTITFPKSNVTQPTLPIQDSKLQEATTAAAAPEATTSATPEPAPATPQPATSTPPRTNNIPALPRTATKAKVQKTVEEIRKPDAPRAPSLREVLRDSKPEEVQEVPAPLRPPPSSSKVDVLVKPKEENASKERKEEQEEINKKRKESSPPVVPPEDDAEGIKKRKESSTSGTVKEEEKKKPSYYGKEELVSTKLKEVKRVATAAKEAVKGLAMGISEDRQKMVNIGVALLVTVAVGAYLYYSYISPPSSVNWQK